MNNIYFILQLSKSIRNAFLHETNIKKIKKEVFAYLNLKMCFITLLLLSLFFSNAILYLSALPITYIFILDMMPSKITSEAAAILLESWFNNGDKKTIKRIKKKLRIKNTIIDENDEDICLLKLELETNRITKQQKEEQKRLEKMGLEERKEKVIQDIFKHPLFTKYHLVVNLGDKKEFNINGEKEYRYKSNNEDANKLLNESNEDNIKFLMKLNITTLEKILQDYNDKQVAINNIEERMKKVLS